MAEVRTSFEGVAFYCVSDAQFFVGTVALLNSLRFAGHVEPLIVLDCGLAPEQRELLETATTVISAPPVRAPSLAKWVAPLRLPAEVMVLFDSDIMVVRSLAPLLELASQGSIVAFADFSDDRFHPVWEKELGARCSDPHTYVNSGFLALPHEPGRSVLERVGKLQGSIDTSRSRWNGGTWNDPWYLPDQDSWNAVLSTRPGGSLVALERELAPAPRFEGVDLLDAQTLDCSYPDGRRPYLLHHWLDKPWLTRTYTEPNPYTRLLRRLTLANDLTVRLRPSQLPFRFRGPLHARADRYGYALRFRADERARRIQAQILSRRSRGQ